MNNTFLPTLKNYAPIKKVVTTQVLSQINTRKTMMKKVKGRQWWKTSKEKITKKTEKEKLKKLNNKIVFDSRMFWKTISLLFQINCFIKRLLDWRKITKRLALTNRNFYQHFRVFGKVGYFWPHIQFNKRLIIAQPSSKSKWKLSKDSLTNFPFVEVTLKKCR